MLWRFIIDLNLARLAAFFADSDEAGHAFQIDAGHQIGLGSTAGLAAGAW